MTPSLHHSIAVLSQLPTPAPGQLETWLFPAVAVLSIVALVKKVFPAKRSENDFVTKTELHQALDTIRDSLDARFLALSEKIEHLTISLHDRLNKIEAALARVDERTK